MITLACLMRNNSGTISDWGRQLNELVDVIPDLRVVVGVGDSTDDTPELLEKFAPQATEIVEVSHGGPNFGSVDNPQRWDLIAGCVRKVLDVVGDPGHKLIWCEADLLWSVDTMLRLLSGTEWHGAVAPMVLANGSRRFYDTWGFRINGEKFLGEEPYAPEEPIRAEEYWKIDSCGSCFVACTEAPTERGNSVRDWLRGWSGHWPATLDNMVWMDSTVEVYHP